MEFCVQFKFWANLAKLQTEWIGLATLPSRGDALPPEQSRRTQRRHAPGHAAACCCASRGRPHPQPALCRVDKAPGGRDIPFLLFEPRRRRALCASQIRPHRSLPSHLRNPRSSAKNPATVYAPEHKLYPTIAPTRAVFPSNSGQSAAASTPPWPASLRPSPLLLFAQLKSWWAPAAFALLISRSTRSWWPAFAWPRRPSAMDVSRRVRRE